MDKLTQQTQCLNISCIFLDRLAESVTIVFLLFFLLFCSNYNAYHHLPQSADSATTLSSSNNRDADEATACGSCLHYNIYSMKSINIFVYSIKHAVLQQNCHFVIIELSGYFILDLSNMFFFVWFDCGPSTRTDPIKPGHKEAVQQFF